MSGRVTDKKRHSFWVQLSGREVTRQRLWWPTCLSLWLYCHFLFSSHVWTSKDYDNICEQMSPWADLELPLHPHLVHRLAFPSSNRSSVMWTLFKIPAILKCIFLRFQDPTTLDRLCVFVKLWYLIRSFERQNKSKVTHLIDLYSVSTKCMAC